MNRSLFITTRYTTISRRYVAGPILSKRIAGPRTPADMMRNHERGGHDWYRACQVFLIVKLHEFSDSSGRQRREIPGGGNQKGSIRRDGMVAFDYL